MKGIVKFYNSKKGYGFIKYGSEDLFFHNSDIFDNPIVLIEGDHVAFNVIENVRGKHAVNILKLNKNHQKKVYE